MSMSEQPKTENRIFVTGYSSKDKTEEDIRALFSKYGSISEFSWKGRFCFIAYSKAEEATEAVNDMNQKDLDGNTFVVEIARAKKKDGECYQCGKIGHFARNCRQKRRSSSSSSRHHKRKSKKHRKRSPTSSSSSSSSSSSRDRKKKTKKPKRKESRKGSSSSSD